LDTKEVPEPFRETINNALKAMEQFHQDWNGKAERLMVRPEAMNEVHASREMILNLRRFSSEAKTGFHMHAASSRSRQIRFLKEKGLRPIEYLNRLNALGPDVVLAHGIWLNAEEMKMIAESETAIIHNPVSNQYLADGIAPVPDYLDRGIKVGLGTDGAASNNSQDMFEVMKTAALLHKVKHLRADLMSASEVFELATIKGAEALGIDNLTGSIEPGKCADILLVNLDSIGMFPCYSMISNFIYSANSRIVQTVIIEGRIVAKNGRCVSIDRSALIAEVRGIEKYFRKKLNL
jgi:5-methylthioadenosine/S-adenosylhomocysteine deaminase